MPNSSYKKRKKQGKCIKDERHALSKEDLAAGHSICEPCRDDLRADIGAERQRRRDEGKCLWCEEPREEGLTVCRVHAWDESKQDSESEADVVARLESHPKRFKGRYGWS
jgi:hypothetical protein